MGSICIVFTREIQTSPSPFVLWKKHYFDMTKIYKLSICGWCHISSHWLQFRVILHTYPSQYSPIKSFYPIYVRYMYMPVGEPNKPLLFYSMEKNTTHLNHGPQISGSFCIVSPSGSTYYANDFCRNVNQGIYELHIYTAPADGKTSTVLLWLKHFFYKLLQRVNHENWLWLDGVQKIF